MSIRWFQHTQTTQHNRKHTILYCQQTPKYDDDNEQNKSTDQFGFRAIHSQLKSHCESNSALEIAPGSVSVLNNYGKLLLLPQEHI